MKTTMRFAPLIRVSTEPQVKKGSSLSTQKEQILKYVEMIGGTIPDHCWRYTGQEHSTQGYERELFDQLLQDCSKNLFDAVIVATRDRLTRDDRRFQDAIETFKQFDIAYYIGTMPQDLWSNDHVLALSLGSKIDEFYARQQNEKSIRGRLYRAKQGVPSAGKLPFGRLYDKKTGKWSIDPEKQAIAEAAARRYLSGENIIPIAQSYGINPSGLFRTLRHKSGDTYVVHFKSKKFRIDEKVTFKIPRLLDEATIEAIGRRAEANLTFSHGAHINQYLCSRMIFCSVCGQAICGYTNRSKKRYYVHKRGKYSVKCSQHKHVPAEMIEQAVLVRLAQTFSDPQKLQQAITEAEPDKEALEALRKEKRALQRRIGRAEQSKQRIIKAIAGGVIEEAEAMDQMEQTREVIRTAEEQLKKVQGYLDDRPDLERLKMFKGKVSRSIKGYLSHDWILRKPYRIQRQMVEAAFPGRDPEGRRYGVYVDYKDGKWQLELHGVVGRELLQAPYTDQDVDPAVKEIIDSVTTSTNR